MKATIILIIFFVFSFQAVSFKPVWHWLKIGKRAGISQDPESRQKDWLSIHPTMYNWKLRKCGLTYDQANAIEKVFEKRGYEAKQAGRIVPGKIYCVFTFSYKKET